MRRHLFAFPVSGLILAATLVSAGPIVLVNTGSPDGLMAAATQPASTGRIEIETGDDFLLNTSAAITSATFTGLVTGATPTIGQINVEIYRIFPLDSDTSRTITVPTRVNSPSDVAFDSRDGLSSLTFTLLGSFTAGNSVLNGIHPAPNQTTGGEGAVTGTEIRFSVDFASAFDLPAGHYFFVPQVEVSGGQFYWLSAPKPIVAPGTPFSPDLQAWIRNAGLDPDWLRIGTDIVGGTTPPTFNMSFSLTGVAVPEGSTFALLGASLAGLGLLRRRRS